MANVANMEPIIMVLAAISVHSVSVIVTIQKVGWSLGFIVPEAMLKELDLKAGDMAGCRVENGRLIITPVRR